MYVHKTSTCRTLHRRPSGLDLVIVCLYRYLHYAIYASCTAGSSDAEDIKPVLPLGLGRALYCPSRVRLKRGCAAPDADIMRMLKSLATSIIVDAFAIGLRLACAAWDTEEPCFASFVFS